MSSRISGVLLLVAFIIPATAAPSVLAVTTALPGHHKPNIVRFNAASFDLTDSAELPVPQQGHPRLAGALDTHSNLYYVSIASSEQRQPTIITYDAHSLKPGTPVAIAQGTISALEITPDGRNVYGMGTDANNVPCFLRLRMDTRDVQAICPLQEDLAFGDFSAFDPQGLLVGNFYAPFTPGLDPYFGVCNVTSGKSSFVRMKRQVAAMAAVPASAMGQSPNAPATIFAVQGNTVVKIDPVTGNFVNVATFPEQPLSPTTTFGGGLLYISYETNEESMYLVTVNPVTGAMSAPLRRQSSGWMMEWLRYLPN